MIKKTLKYLFRILLAIIGLLVITYIVLYIAMWGDYEVAKTVAQNKSIPHIEVNGALIHAETYGDSANQPIIVIHGGPGNDFKYLLSLKELENEYFVIFYDQRGTGLSARVPAEELTLESTLEDLNAIVEYYAYGEKVNLIGHSWGGMVASGYIAKYPDKVHQAVLAEPGFLNTEMHKEFMDKTDGFKINFTWKVIKHLLISWFESRHVGGPDDQAKQDYFMTRFIWGSEIENHPMSGYYCNGDIHNTAFDEWRFGSLASQAIQQAGLNEKGKLEIDLVSGVENFQDTVLFIASSCNKYIGIEHQKKQMKYFPHAHLEVIEDAGHTMFGEQPEQSLKIIREYLK